MNRVEVMKFKTQLLDFLQKIGIIDSKDNCNINIKIHEGGIKYVEKQMDKIIIK